MGRRVVEILENVILMEPGEREAALDRACGQDAALRGGVERLLRAQDEAGPFLSAATREPAEETRVAGGMQENPGSVIGRYKLLEVIGEGGFGRVFMGEQREPVTRRVAVKVIKLGMDTRQVVARFEAERQALAMMDHDCIARVFDAGATGSGRPYFVMELVRGEPITAFCDAATMPIEERLGLFLDVCAGVQHAHQKGIIHRDIKPSNVLVGERDGRPRPKIIDFGIAKATGARLTDKTLFTEFRQFIGTPEYMSPEQAGGVDIDTRSDIYSLGVLLYELLTGSTPLERATVQSAGLADLPRLIQECRTPRPSARLSTHQSAVEIAAQRRTEPKRLGTLLRGDLDWIVLKAVEKDRGRRYATVDALAEDVRRFLSHEPVSATPPSAAYRLRKFARKHRGGVVAGSLVAGALLLGLAAASAGLVCALSERNRADVAAESARLEAGRAREVVAFLKGMLESASPYVAGGEDTALLGRIAQDSLTRLDAGAVDDPLIDAELRQTLALVMNHTGDLERSEALVRGAYETRLGLLGAAHPDTLSSQAGLALTLGEMGRVDEAASLAEAAVETSTRELGVHRATGEALDSLVRARSLQGRLEDVERLTRDQIEVCEAVHGPDHAATLTARGNLGSALHARGRSAEAEGVMRALLTIQTDTLGPDHPSTLYTLNTLATILAEAFGRLDEALELQQRAAEGSRAAFGNDHPATINRLANLGSVLTMLDRYDEAEKVQREAYEAGLRRFGALHEMSLYPGSALAKTLERLGRLDESIALHQEVVEGMREAFGDQNPGTLTAMVALAHTLRSAGRAAEAEPIIDEALQRLRAGPGAAHVYTVMAMRRRGQTLTDLGRFPEAEQQLREAEALSLRERPDHVPERQSIISSFADLYDVWHAAEPGQGHDASAAQWRARVQGP